MRISPTDLARRLDDLETDCQRCRRWRRGISPWAPWVLLEVLVAIGFMSSCLGEAIEDAGHVVDAKTVTIGLATGAVYGGTTLAVIAFSVAGVAALMARRDSRPHRW